MEKGNLFIYSWFIDKNETERTCIRIYGVNENNENICLRINDFTPYIYLELPDDIKWTELNAQMLGNKIDEICGKNNLPLKKRLIFKRKLYYANINEKNEYKLFSYLLCTFSTQKDIKILSYNIRKPISVLGLGRLTLKMHEQDASPILQLVCVRDIPTCGWITYIGKKVEEENKLTYCKDEYICSYKSLQKLEKNTVAKPLILSWDIEINSHDVNKMPSGNHPKDKIFQISCVVGREGDNEDKYKKYLLTLGECDQKMTGNDVIIKEYNHEADLLIGFRDLINELNPNILIGYNIFGFDIPYIIERSKLNLCYDFSKFSFNKYTLSTEEKITWSSSAYKNQEFSYFDAEGRLFIDLLPLVKRDFKMDNYKLKTITQYFLGETKDPLSYKGIFKCYRIGMKKGEKGKRALAICGKYCVQDSLLVLKLMDKLKTWVGLCEMAKTCNVEPFTLYTQGQQIKVYSQFYKYCMYNNIVVEKNAYISKDTDRYTGAYVFNPIPGIYDDICPFDFASLYPTTIIAYNIDYSTLVNDPNIPDEKCHIMQWEDHIGCIHDPKVIQKGELTEKINIIENELKKLRKNRDSKKNKDEKNKIQLHMNDLKLSSSKLREQRVELVKCKPKIPICEKRYFRFLKEPMGVMPTVLQNLLDMRKKVRKIDMKEIENQIVKLTNEQELKNIDNSKLIKDLYSTLDVLDKRQLAYKVSANSMYGAMGVRRGYLPFMPGAMCTTYMGRINIEKVATEIPNKYGGQLIYGDTDSNYVHFPNIKTPEECWNWAEYVAKEVTKIFPQPISLAFEDVIYRRFFILTKKRYMYTSCKKIGNDLKTNNKIGKKGVLLARRDNSQFIRDVYEKTVDMIFSKKSKNDVLFFVLDEINRLCSGSISLKNFIVTKSIGNYGDLTPVEFFNEKGKRKVKIGDYTVEPLSSDLDTRTQQLENKKASSEKEYYLLSLPAQVQLAERMRKRGYRVEVGSRIEYVITVNGGHNAKQYEKVESAEYFLEHKDILHIDYHYYLKLLANPLDQILKVAFNEEDFVLKQYKFRSKEREKFIQEFKNIFYYTNIIFE
jgi:DNA polymerase elongation subunit (family B)